MLAKVEEPPVEAVNFHVWQPCNMRCVFCFATFRDVKRDILPDGHLTRADAMQVVTLLAQSGFQKITFVGGEPFLCPWLPDLISVAKDGGVTTCVVTNGSLVNDELLNALKGLLDWFAISIDSASTHVLRTVGRLTAGRPRPMSEYIELCQGVAALGIKIKVNTVVTAANRFEDLSDAIISIRPSRWKIMQVLPIEGQNSGSVDPLVVSLQEFWEFIERHRGVEEYGIAVVPESNDDMIGSYAMVDPAGRFFDNVQGRYTYSDPILLSGVAAAMAQVTIIREKFLARGGQYDWGGMEKDSHERSSTRRSVI